MVELKTQLPRLETLGGTSFHSIPTQHELHPTFTLDIVPDPVQHAEYEGPARAEMVTDHRKQVLEEESSESAKKRHKGDFLHFLLTIRYHSDSLTLLFVMLFPVAKLGGFSNCATTERWDKVDGGIYSENPMPEKPTVRPLVYTSEGAVPVVYLPDLSKIISYLLLLSNTTFFYRI